jgi:uncharacterized protein
MIAIERIREAARILADAAHPLKIILFGSYAQGRPTEESDVDLLVIERVLANKLEEMVRLRRLLRPLRIPVDILVYSEDDVREWGHLPGTTLYWALKQGKVLHEATG